MVFASPIPSINTKDIQRLKDLKKVSVVPLPSLSSAPYPAVSDSMGSEALCQLKQLLQEQLEVGMTLVHSVN